MINTIVDIHILQTVPPSNLNRDDTGSPKTATFGGVRRARVSSQAWKRATRQAFDGYLNTDELGTRTKRVVEIVATQIERDNPDVTAEQAQAATKDVLVAAGLKVVEPKGKKGAPAESGYLLFLSAQQVSALAGLAAEALAAGEAPDKKIAQALVKGKNSIDLALFGRMVADVSDLNVDASCQVAHALSTHAIETEYDYFTAVDDQKAATAEEDAGAGMIGTVEFDSATLYRYATINVNQLEKNLGDDVATVRAIHAFLSAFIRSMPTGKQNTFANRTLPDAVVISVRDDQPVSYVGAFEDAIVSDGGRVVPSAQALATYANQLAAAYGDKPKATWVVAVKDAVGVALESLGQRVQLDEAVNAVTNLVADRLATDGSRSAASDDAGSDAADAFATQLEPMV